jgi:O-antigen ligase
VNRLTAATIGLATAAAVGIFVGSGQVVWALLLTAAVLTVALRPPVWLGLCLVALTLPAGTVFGSNIVKWYDLASLFAVACWILRPARAPRILVRDIVFLLAWSVICTLLALFQFTAFTGLVVIFQAGVLMLIAASTPKEQSRAVLVRVAISIYVASCIIAIQALASVSNGGGIAGGAVRVGGGVESALGKVNFLAALMVLGAVAVISVWPIIESRRVKLTVLVSAPILAVGLLTVGSKNQIIALALFCVVVFVFGANKIRGHIPRRLILAAAMGFVLWLSYGYLTIIFQPVTGTGVFGYRTFQDRVFLWRLARDTIVANPLTGIGPNSFRVGDLPYQAHNMFLQVAVETGLIGLFLYLRVYLAALRGHRRGVTKTVAWRVLLGLTLSGMAEPTFRSIYYDAAAWTLLGVVVALAATAENTPEVSRVKTQPAAALVK